MAVHSPVFDKIARLSIEQVWILGLGGDAQEVARLCKVILIVLLEVPVFPAC